MLPFRVTEQQFFPLVQGDFLFRCPEGVQFDFSVKEADRCDHALAFLVQVDFRFERQADQALPQLLADFHRAADLQVRKHLTDHPFGLVQRVFHQAPAFVLILPQQPDQLSLLRFGADQVAAGQHPGTAFRDRLKVRRDPSADLEAAGAQVDHEMKRYGHVPDQPAAQNLPALIHDPQGRLAELLQHFLRKKIRQGDHPVPGRTVSVPGFLRRT